MTDVWSIWSPVDEALRIVDVAILVSASRACWIGRIFHVNENDSRPAGVISWHSTDRVNVSRFFIGNNIMGSPNGEAFEMSS